jgi:hypothetical protein
MSSATFHARRIFKMYVHPEGECALTLSDAVIQQLYDDTIMNYPTPDSYDKAERETIDYMRESYFPKFLNSDVCSALIIAKKGLPKAIMVENEYGQEELDELDEMTGNAQPIKLQLAHAGADKEKLERLAAKGGAEHLAGSASGQLGGSSPVAKGRNPLNKASTMASM